MKIFYNGWLNISLLESMKQPINFSVNITREQFILEIFPKSIWVTGLVGMAVAFKMKWYGCD